MQESKNGRYVISKFVTYLDACVAMEESYQLRCRHFKVRVRFVENKKCWFQ